MKRIPTFLAGMFTAAVIGGLGVGALAASGAVTFNASNLMFNGQQISAKGEGYTLDNGCQAPASITYTDEKGGGTTYLPVRRISELLDVETGWDGATGSVTVGKAVDTTAVPADYSDWSEEEEAAYQEFKGMWEISDNAVQTAEEGIDSVSVFADYVGPLGKEQFIAHIEAVGTESFDRMANRFCWEVIAEYAQNNIYFGYTYPLETMGAIIAGGVMRNAGAFTQRVLHFDPHDIRIDLRMT